MYKTTDRLLILDADGTLVDSFSAIGTMFQHHGMDIGNLGRFQKRRHLFKYLGGMKEFPRNMVKHMKWGHKELLDTLTEVYRQEAQLFPGIAGLMHVLIEAPDIRVGMVTRNICHEPITTLTHLFARHGLDLRQLDFIHYITLREQKTPYFRNARERLDINPARAYACGDEHKDYEAAVANGMHPFIVSYGVESHDRLQRKFGIPQELISPDPHAFSSRVRHALDLPA